MSPRSAIPFLLAATACLQTAPATTGPDATSGAAALPGEGPLAPRPGDAVSAVGTAPAVAVVRAPDPGGRPLLGAVTEATWVGPFGRDRPVRVRVPAGYDPARPAPLVMLLHGYMVWGDLQDFYLQLSDIADEAGFVFVAPDGLRDPAFSRYWNATDACCDLFGRGNDDVAYLVGLLDEIQSVVAIDPKRVFLTGHSNGGFMAHRLACEIPDRVAAIVSLAGATFQDEARCPAGSPVSVLEIHGTFDEIVWFGGGSLPHSDGRLVAYPGARRTAEAWARRNGCGAYAASGDDLDLDVVVPFRETSTESWLGCPAHGEVALWTMRAVWHVPFPTSSFAHRIWEFLSSHPKP